MWVFLAEVGMWVVFVILLIGALLWLGPILLVREFIDRVSGQVGVVSKSLDQRVDAELKTLKSLSRSDLQVIYNLIRRNARVKTLSLVGGGQHSPGTSTQYLLGMKERPRWSFGMNCASSISWVHLKAMALLDLRYSRPATG